MSNLYPWLEYEQATKMLYIASQLGVQPEVINTHTSQSRSLPVVSMKVTTRTNDFEFIFRDNFADVNMLVKSREILDIPLDVLYTEKDFDWYLSKIDTKRNYSYQHWTDEEISDPRILRVKMPNGNWSEVKGEAKDRWNNRMNDTAWFRRDWSNKTLIHKGNIPFDENSKFYIAEYAYAEGIKERSENYSKPCQKFIYCCEKWEQIMKIIEYLTCKPIVPC